MQFFADKHVVHERSDLPEMHAVHDDVFNFHTVVERAEMVLVVPHFERADPLFGNVELRGANMRDF